MLLYVYPTHWCHGYDNQKVHLTKFVKLSAPVTHSQQFNTLRAASLSLPSSSSFSKKQSTWIWSDLWTINHYSMYLHQAYDIQSIGAGRDAVLVLAVRLINFVWSPSQGHRNLTKILFCFRLWVDVYQKIFEKWIYMNHASGNVGISKWAYMSTPYPFGRKKNNQNLKLFRHNSHKQNNTYFFIVTESTDVLLLWKVTSCVVRSAESSWNSSLITK